MHTPGSSSFAISFVSDPCESGSAANTRKMVPSIIPPALAPSPSISNMHKVEADAFKVFVRVRPYSSKETCTKEYLQVEDHVVTSTQIWLLDTKAAAEVSFTFHAVLGMEASTREVYGTAVSELVDSVIQGYSATVFAYGMTGAGKTHTMFGNLAFPHLQDPGIVPLALMDCFAAVNREARTEMSIKMSYLEIYNEQIRDLLQEKPSNRPQGLMLLEDGTKGMIIPDLTDLPVADLTEVISLVIAGNGRRMMAATGANQLSSRSHAILWVTFEQRDKTRSIITSKLALIDLAGSERAASTENRGIRLLEGANINRSLLALGNCINLLSDSSKTGKFVPYRDSKLTRLLKDSLTGRTKALMIACISPAWSCYEETVHTLKYAERAQHIRVKAVRNVREAEAHGAEYREIIVGLREEIEVLRAKLRTREKGTEGVDELGQNMLQNLEEFWELKQSLLDIDSLNEDNQRQVHSLSLVPNSTELQRLQTNIRDNETVRSALVGSLKANLQQKGAFQKALVSLKDMERKGRLEMQVAYQALRLEKEDLYLRNQEMRQRMQNTEKEAVEKEKTIEKMKAELEFMRRKLGPEREEAKAKSVSPSPVSLGALRDVPVRALKISNLQDARLIHKTGSKREIRPMDSTEGFISNYTGTAAETAELELCSERSRGKKAVGLRGAFSNLHRVDGKKPAVNRSVSVARERKDKSPLNSSRTGRKTPLAVISNQNLPRYHEDTEKLVRKNFRRVHGETPTVVISLASK